MGSREGRGGKGLTFAWPVYLRLAETGKFEMQRCKPRGFRGINTTRVVVRGLVYIFVSIRSTEYVVHIVDWSGT